MDLSTAAIGQFLLPTHDFDRAIAFYRDALGLPLLFTAPPQMAFFQCGGVRMLVGLPTDSRVDHPVAGLYFQVADIDAVHDTLASRGVEFDSKPHVVHRTPDFWVWLAEFHDADGNMFALMSRQPPGAPRDA